MRAVTFWANSRIALIQSSAAPGNESENRATQSSSGMELATAEGSSRQVPGSAST
jgi:hypothetical protein